MTEYRKAKQPTAKEDVEQECLLRWSEFVKGKYPEVRLLYHIPNGGSRNKLEAEHLRRQGVKAGVPDICLPVPRGRYHGLYIELKAKDNTPTQKQKDWLAALDAQGYKTAVCWGWETASELLEEYFCLPAQKSKLESFLSLLSDWQDLYASPAARPVNGYELLGDVIATIEEMGGLKK